MPALELKLTVRAVTPVYLAGAEPKGVPELRAPSFKGLLRFWYRAFDPDFLDREPRLFGGAGGTYGQSPFLLRVDANGTPRRWRWDQATVGRFDEGRGRNTKNGIRYLANMALSNRQAIAPGTECTMRVLCLRRTPAPECRRALLGSLWLLFHLGGAGSRSRRGFGSFSLERWAPQDQWPEIEHLPLLAGCKDVNEGRSSLLRALEMLQSPEWPGWPDDDRQEGKPERRAARLNPHVGQGPQSAFRFALHPDGFRTDRPNAWAAALNEAGRALQDFRVRREPDYSEVKASLRERRPLRRAPERATFGLPIAFRFQGVRGQAEFQAFRGTPAGRDKSDRHASPLFVRVLRIGDRLHPACFRLDGPVPASGPGSTSAVRTGRGGGSPLAPPANLALDDFMNAVADRWSSR